MHPTPHTSFRADLPSRAVRYSRQIEDLREEIAKVAANDSRRSVLLAHLDRVYVGAGDLRARDPEIARLRKAIHRAEIRSAEIPEIPGGGS